MQICDREAMCCSLHLLPIELAQDDARAITSRHSCADDGRTAMHMASKEGAHKVVEVLLTYDADKNAKDSWGQTPLQGE